MAKFLNNPKTIRIGKANWQVLLEPLHYEYQKGQVWTVPAGKLSDGPSVPKWLRWLIRPKKFMLSGFLHDDIRTKWSTGNASTDGVLRNAAVAEGKGIKGFQAYMIYLGVRIGTHIRFRSKVPDRVVNEAKREWAKANGSWTAKVEFDPVHSQLSISR